MAQIAYPKSGGATTDDQYRELFSTFVDTGALTQGGYLATGDSSGMNVKVAPGFAVVNGVAAKSTAVESLPIGAAPGGALNRIDTVCLQLDYSTDPVVKLVVVPGVAAAAGSQAPPALTLTGTVKALWPIADVAVGPTTVTIAAANVTDRRTFIGTNVGFWTSLTRPTAPSRRIFGMNLSTGEWEGWSPETGWVTVVSNPSALGLIVMRAATVDDLRHALNIYVQGTDPGQSPGRVWIKTP